VHSAAVPPNTLRGVIIDRETGHPIVSAQIFLNETTVGALADSMGWFSLEAPSSGEYEVVTRFIGYREQRLRVEMGDPNGAAARIALAPSRIPNCGLIVNSVTRARRGSVRVFVRDVLTGIGPNTPVALRVRNARGPKLDSARPSGPDRSVYLTAGRGDGPFDVEVVAPGYEPWARNGIVIERDECGIRKSPPLQAWLLPKGDSSPSDHEASVRWWR
jgi:hypothetical protein